MKGATHRDSSGMKLTDYPRPSVAVDSAVLTLSEDHEPLVLQVRRHNGPGWALPGTFLHEGETLAEAVDRSLRDKADLVGLTPRQLHVFDAPDRDPRGWVLSVAHIAVAPLPRLDARNPKTTRLISVESPGNLSFDHAKIIQRAVEDLRAHYAERPDPDQLLGEEFTMRELRLVHDAIAGRKYQADNFRRKMEPYVVATGRSTSGGRGRPAELFRRKPR